MVFGNNWTELEILERGEWLTFFLLNPTATGPAPEVVCRDVGSCLKDVSETEVFDAVVCGGTLGIFVAAALALKGFKVAVVEKGRLQGVCYISGQFLRNV